MNVPSDQCVTWSEVTVEKKSSARLWLCHLSSERHKESRSEQQPSSQLGSGGAMKLEELSARRSGYLRDAFLSSTQTREAVAPLGPVDGQRQSLGPAEVTRDSPQGAHCLGPTAGAPRIQTRSRYVSACTGFELPIRRTRHLVLRPRICKLA